MIAKFLFLILISLFFFLRTYDSAPDEFTYYDLLLILGLFSIVLLIQMTVSFLARRKPTVQNLLLGTFTAINIFSLHVLLIDSITRNGWHVILAMTAVGAFIAYTVYSILEDSALARKASVAIAGLACVATLGLTHSSDTVVVAPDTTQSGTVAANVPLIEFKQKPNVYFMFFDSVLPRSLLKKHLELETTALHDVLDQEFTKFRNVFSDGAPTNFSLNSFLAFDHEYFKQALEHQFDSNGVGLFFSGFASSPLMQIFKHNGYTTNTAFDIPFFGDKKGPYLDNYFTDAKLAACSLVDKKFENYLFFGFCRAAQSEWLLKAVGKPSNPQEFMLDSIETALSTGTPQAFMGYIYSPGHTAGSYIAHDPKMFADYQEQYTRTSETAAGYLKAIMSYIKENDPDAIVTVFGDHGPWLSRGLENNDDRTEADNRFMLLDRYGIFGGIYPKEKCREWLFAEDGLGYKTPIMVAQEVLQCISDGEQPFIQRSIRGPAWQWGSEYGEFFENYIYE